MKILTTVTETKILEVDIAFPHFVKEGDSEYSDYIKVIDEESSLRVTAFRQTTGTWYVNTALERTSQIAGKLPKCVPITEEEFNAFFLNAMTQIVNANMKQMEAAA